MAALQARCCSRLVRSGKVLIQKRPHSLHPLAGMLKECLDMPGIFYQPVSFGRMCAGIESVPIMWLIGYLIKQVGDDKDSSRCDLMNNLHWTNLGEPHPGDLLAPVDYKMRQWKSRQTSKAAKELDKITFYIGKAALDNQAA